MVDEIEQLYRAKLDEVYRSMEVASRIPRRFLFGWESGLRVPGRKLEMFRYFRHVRATSDIAVQENYRLLVRMNNIAARARRMRADRRDTPRPRPAGG